MISLISKCWCGKMFMSCKSLLLMNPKSSLISRSMRINASNNPERCDVAIFGGGIMGSSVAYYLKDKLSANSKVIVIERDPSYLRASTTLSVGGIRQQFSLPENIQMSMYSARFLKQIKKYLSHLDMEPPDICFNPTGYLTMAESGEQMATLRRNFQIQKQYGASVEWLQAEDIQKRFPMINVDDGIGAGVLGTDNEGWFDPYQLLMAFKNKAMFLGAQFHHGLVVDFLPGSADTKECNEALVQTPDGSTGVLEFETGIICTGYDSKRLAQSLGYYSEISNIGIGRNKPKRDLRGMVDFPIEPRKRYVFVLNCREQCEDWFFPFLVDKSGIYCRKEGRSGNFICGRSPKTMAEEPETVDLDVDYSYFDSYIHETLAHRIPAFKAIKLRSAWAGFYDYNRLDQNPIIGKDPFFKNIYWATGFSGHGIQMGPAVGQAMMELILNGQFQTIDLTRFSWKRILDNQPIKEQNVY